MSRTLKRNTRGGRKRGRKRGKRTLKKTLKRRRRNNKKSRARKRTRRTKRKRRRKVRKYIKKKDMIQTGGFKLRNFLPQAIVSSLDAGTHKFNSLKNGIKGKRSPMSPNVLVPHDDFYNQSVDPRPPNVESAMNKGVASAIGSYNSSTTTSSST